MKQPPKKPIEIVRKACEMYENNIPPKKICEELGVPKSTLYRWTTLQHRTKK